jgi:hypothetical protein
MRLQKVASNEFLVLWVAYTLTDPVTFRQSGRIKLVTGTPKKAQKWCAELWEAWASMSFQSVKVENGESLGPPKKSCEFRKMTDPDCQINKIRLQKVASNEHLVLRGRIYPYQPGNLSVTGSRKTCDGDLEKGPKNGVRRGRKMMRGILEVVWEMMMDNGNKGCVLAFKLRSLMSQTHLPFRTAWKMRGPCKPCKNLTSPCKGVCKLS